MALAADRVREGAPAGRLGRFGAPAEQPGDDAGRLSLNIRGQLTVPHGQALKAALAGYAGPFGIMSFDPRLVRLFDQGEEQLTQGQRFLPDRDEFDPFSVDAWLAPPPSGVSPEACIVWPKSTSTISPRWVM